MGFIPARCTQCGAEIKVDDTKDAGICEHCGTPFVTEKVIKNDNTYISNIFHGATINVLGGDANNLLKLAQASIESHDEKRAFEYANKAIEIQSNNRQAWLIKMQALYLKGTMSELHAAEIVSCGNNAIACANKNEIEETKHDVAMVFLDMALGWMRIATQKIGDTTQLSLMNLTDYGAKTSTAYKDIADRNLIFKYVEGCGDLIAAVPRDQIDKYQDLSKKREAISKEYMKYCHEETERLSLYNGKLTATEIEKRKKYIFLLQHEEKEQIESCSYQNDRKNSLGDEGLFGKIMGFFNE